jgi:hypothetical protein
VKRLCELEGQTPKMKEEPKIETKIKVEPPIEKVVERYDLKKEAQEEEKTVRPKPIEPPREQARAEVKDEQKLHPSRYDTLVRFAAVELEGTIKT